MKVLIVGSMEENMQLHGVLQKARKLTRSTVHLEMQESQSMRNVQISEQWSLKTGSTLPKKKRSILLSGMDDPLVGGIVDVFEAEGLRSVRTAQKCRYSGRLQGFFQGSYEKYDIPTAAYENF